MKKEAAEIAEERLAELRSMPYEELEAFIEPIHKEVVGRSGDAYQLEIKAVWDDKQGGDLRVFVLIDDGGLRSFFPLSREFLISPRGEIK
jgi:hypothetical protein